MPITETDLRFISRGAHCAATLFEPADRSTTGPCIVMAHGLGGLRKVALPHYARAFAEAGYRVLSFDYRYWGDSDGASLQIISIRKQLEDWENAIAHARTLPGVDTSRIALFGTSLSGGHVVTMAARDSTIAAIMAQCPMMDGRLTVRQSIRNAGVLRSLGILLLGLADLAGGTLGRRPIHVPLVAPPGKFGLMVSQDALAGIELMIAASPPDVIERYGTSGVEVSARAAVHLSQYRPVRVAHRVRCPTLIIACREDSTTPDRAAREVAKSIGTRARLVLTDLGHFDVFLDWGFRFSFALQLDFLREVLPAPQNDSSADQPTDTSPV